MADPPEHVAALTEELHSKSRIPLLIGADLERGAGQQFAGQTALPPLAAIASLEDVQAIRRSATVSASEARSLGINWIYAPDCDIDVEPNNPIIGTRSFGSDPERVGEYAAAWIDACQAEGVLACAKHFPGHGRTTVDSHKTLPRVEESAETLRATDLVPFRRAIERGVASIMSAHVAFPALDPSGAPATLSRPILTDLLRNELGFSGIVVTDALIMEGVLGGGEAEAVVRALYAGCDSLLYPSDVVASEQAVRKAIDDKRLDADSIQHSLERRRRWARWAALSKETNRPTRDESGWSIQLAEQVVHPLKGKIPRLPQPWNLVIVDDDVGGPYPAPSRDPLISSLRAGGIDLRIKGEGNDGPRRWIHRDRAVWRHPRLERAARLFRRCEGSGTQRSLENAGSKERLDRSVQPSATRRRAGRRCSDPVRVGRGSSDAAGGGASAAARGVAVAKGGRSAGTAG